METPNDDYDNPWKTGLERYLMDFVMLFSPGLAAEIDWSVEPEFRDQELRQVARDAKHGSRRQADGFPAAYKRRPSQLLCTRCGCAFRDVAVLDGMSSAS
ncbi:hypothetical protein [Pseudoduganella sp. OTU4001]|uniref:hypothetical protein n=1 Tax=Pseudoduganella sp. OTU4001 TaxID=3043854 RepID=UPI00313D9F33